MFGSGVWTIMIVTIIVAVLRLTHQIEVVVTIVSCVAVVGASANRSAVLLDVTKAIRQTEAALASVLLFPSNEDNLSILLTQKEWRATLSVFFL